MQLRIKNNLNYVVCFSLNMYVTVGNVLEKETENVLQSQRNLEQSSTQFRMELNGLKTERWYVWVLDKSCPQS